MKKIIASVLAIAMMVMLTVVPASALNGDNLPENTVFKGTPSKITADGAIDQVWNNAVEYNLTYTISESRTRQGESVTFKNLWDDNNFYYLVKITGDKDVVVDGNTLIGAHYTDKTNLLLITPDTNATNYNGRHNDVSIQIHRENPRDNGEDKDRIVPCTWDNEYLIASTNSVITKISEDMSIYETGDAEATYYIQVAIPWTDKSLAVDGTNVGIDVSYEDNMSAALINYLGMENKSANSYYAEGYGESVDNPKLGVARILSDIPITDRCVHSWDEGVITTEPTLTVPGVKTYTCKICGSTKTESVRPTGFITDDDAIFMGTPSKITDGAIDTIWDKAIEYTLDGRLPAEKNRIREGLSVSFKNLWDKNNFYYLVKVVGDKDVMDGENKLTGSFYADKTNLLLVTPATSDGNYNGRHNDVSVKIHRDNPKTAPEGGSWETSDWIMPCTWDNTDLINSTNSVIPQMTESLSIYETGDTEETFYIQVAIPWKDASIAKQGTNVGIDVSYEDSMYAALADYLGVSRESANCYYADGYGESVDNPSLAVTRMLSEVRVDTTCTHENTEIRNAVDATVTEKGYSGDIYCIDEGVLIKPGTVIHALGDVTGDNSVDVKDLVRIKKYVANNTTELFTGTGDVDNSGKIDATDIAILRKALLVI